MRKILLLLFLLLPLVSVSSLALDLEDVTEIQGEQFYLKDVEEMGEAYLGDVSIDTDLDAVTVLKDIWAEGKSYLSGILRDAVGSCMVLLAIVLLFGLGEGLESGIKVLPILPIASCLALTAVAVGDVFSLVGMGRESMEEMAMFSKVLVPSMAAATSATGAVSSAVAKQMATLLFSDVLITLINTVFLPLTFAFIALSVGHAALGNEGLKRIATFIKWLVQTSLGLVLLGFIGYLNISGAISGSADAMTVKAAKFTMSNVIPVIGGILSDAAETVLVGASLLRSAIGVFGMLVIVGICLVPFLQLGAHYLAYKITSALASMVADSRSAGLIDAIGSAFGLVLAMTAASALLLLISVVSAISVVVT